MFVAVSLWKKNGTAAPPEKALSLLGEGSQVKGDFYTPGALRIEGQFQGSLRVEGRLVVAPTAEVKGTLHATQVLIAGAFEGEILTTDLLEIAATARIRGEIRAKRMETQSGARLEVRCWIGEDLLETLPEVPPTVPVSASAATQPSPAKNRRGA